MSRIHFTEQQEKAITGRGDRLLVSAAAGSGKTAVLVERVLRYLAQGGDVQRLIIMTFTEAAAAEMKQKLRKAVEQEIQRQGGGDHLTDQSVLIDSAEIGTIHSVCLNLITHHFEQLELDPRCRLMDETAAQEAISEEADTLLEELYSSEDAEICHFLACYAAGKNDEELKALLISGLDFLEKEPLPEDYIRRTLAPYHRGNEGLFACFSEDGLYHYLHQCLEELTDHYAFLQIQIGRHPYLKNFPLLLAFLEDEQQSLNALHSALGQRDYNRFSAALSSFKFRTLTWKKLTEPTPDEEAKTFLNKLRDDIKNRFKKLLAITAQSEEEEIARLEKQGALLTTYFQLCMTLRKRLTEKRRRNGWITYQDMEQLAVQLLVRRYDPETDILEPTPLALQLRRDYDEIIIDEFQDTNRAQDLIFRALSQNGKNLFMVGDIKQSIYRFRGAEPEIFNQKRAQSAPFSTPALNAPTVLELNANFRSHPGVLTFTNHVFEAIMRPELGGVCYDDRERLRPGREFLEENADRAEIHWIRPEEDPETGQKQESILTNARYAAALIEKAVAERQMLLLPDRQQRPVEYRDFAILLRTGSGTASVFEQELQNRGIPTVNRSSGIIFFDLPEVQSILSYLLVLNNPYDDIALVSLLYGDYFRFSVGELAEMRQRHRPLYDDLRQAADHMPKAKRAYETIEHYRRLADELYVYHLLYRIYQESGVFAAYSAEESGAEKCANLELLAEDARSFEQEGYRGLYAFVQHIRLSRSGAQSGAKLKSDDNSVQILTVHKSKGLEFPICIFGDCHKEINLRDLSSKILLHSRFGAATEQIEPDLYFSCRSLAQEVLADQMMIDCVSEEERVLYVALTRPISKLILLLHMNEKTLEGRTLEGAALKGALPTWLLKKKKMSFAQWMVLLLAGRQEGAELRSHMKIPNEPLPALGAKWIEGSTPASKPAPAQEQEAIAHFDRSAFHARLDWQYPHLSAVRLPAKLSVSELKGLREQEEDAEPLLEERIRPAEPQFIRHFRPRGNEIGNALHQALQFCDFSRLRQDPPQELLRLVQEGFILERQRQMIDPEKLRRFTQSACFQDLMNAEYYRKEERFLFPMRAAELFGPEAEGEILIQGVLDCYSVRNGAATVLDYKTDRVQNAQLLIDRYRTQMDLYEQALKRVKGLHVAKKIIYSFSLEKEILLP